MDKFFAYQRDSRLPCKYGRTCFQKNQDHLDKYKHPLTKEDLQVDNKKKTGKKIAKKHNKYEHPLTKEDLQVDNKIKTGKNIAKKRNKYEHPLTKEDLQVGNKKKTGKKIAKKKCSILNSPRSRTGESSNVNPRNNPPSDNSADYEMNDMEVPESSNVSLGSEARSSISSNNMNNLQHSNDYIVPSIRQRPQQQQRQQQQRRQQQRRQQPQLLLSSTVLDDCGGDSIVPCTPTLFTPRRLDGETVRSPHVPSSRQVERFTFIGESQASQVEVPDSNDGEQQISGLDSNDGEQQISGLDSNDGEQQISGLDSNDGEQQISSQPIVRQQNESNPIHWNQKISELFLVGDMPKEFYVLWNFCSKKCPAHPEDAFLSIGLKLVGPYDVLAGRMNEYDTKDVNKTVLHWRYYYDPPEFQTIIASTDSEFHIGYYRDRPFDMPVFVATNDSKKDCIIQKTSNNVFYAIRKIVQNMTGNVAAEFEKELFSYEHHYITENLSRKASAVAKTFHKAGIVVPYDSQTDVGYRPLAQSERTLRTILQTYRESSESKKIQAMDKLQPIINYANIACDECDFGTGLELGIDIFCDGNPGLHRICQQLLVTAYSLLRRPQFGTIIKAHLANRRSGPNMSIL